MAEVCGQPAGSSGALGRSDFSCRAGVDRSWGKVWASLSEELLILTAGPTLHLSPKQVLEEERMFSGSAASQEILGEQPL